MCTFRISTDMSDLSSLDWTDKSPSSARCSFGIREGNARDRVSTGKAMVKRDCEGTRRFV